ncbi:MAG: hypothetical protein AAGG02_05605 [Cyanobacteria bacterium P01_H01_bin.15]
MNISTITQNAALTGVLTKEMMLLLEMIMWTDLEDQEFNALNNLHNLIEGGQVILEAP